MKPGEEARIIRADKRGWPRLAVHSMIVGRMRKGLFRVRAQGLERLRASMDAEPGGTLFVANHSCWWDLFLAHYLNEQVPVDGYGMMEHANLKRFRFFNRIGAFSVDREDLASVRASLDYTCELLERPRSGVWIFPQGKIVANDARPLDFRPGLRALVRRAGRVRITPAALRYEFWQDERPEAFVRFSEPRWYTRDDLPLLLGSVEERLIAELDALNVDVRSQEAGRFTTLLQGRESISERYGRFVAGLRRERPG
ncbi:lysophospholipid acyltransferase family protein [Isosphaeraceae bacterium EP7]